MSVIGNKKCITCSRRKRKTILKLKQTMTSLSMLVLFTAYFPSLTGLKSSCETSDAAEGESAKVICNFAADISKSKQDFEVKLDKEFVLNCQWHSDGVECYPKEGYLFNGNVTNQLILEIPNVKKEHGGQYKCVVTPSEPEDVSSCFLNVTRFVHMSITTLISETETPSTRIYYHEISIVLGVIVLFTVIVILVLLLTKFSIRLDRCLKIRPKNIIYKKRNRDEKEWRPQLGAEGEDFLPPESGTQDEL